MSSSSDSNRFRDLFAEWIVKTKAPNNASDYYMALMEADSFLLTEGISKISIFSMNHNQAIPLLTSLQKNSKFLRTAVSASHIFKTAIKHLDEFLSVYEEEISAAAFDDIISMVDSAEHTPKHDPKPDVVNAEQNASTDVGDILALIINDGIKYIDRRSDKGALWLIGGVELRPCIDKYSICGHIFRYKPEGGNASHGQPCWWYVGRGAGKKAQQESAVSPTAAPRIPSNTQKSEDSERHTAPLKPSIKTDSSKRTLSEKTSFEFDSVFQGEIYQPLRASLISSGITTLDLLKEINIWTYMNSHSLYSIQDRLTICTELTRRINAINRSETVKSPCSIEWEGTIFHGDTPSLAFVKLLQHIIVTYPLKFRGCINAVYPATNHIAIYRYNNSSKSRLKLMNPEAYVDSDLTLTSVKQYSEWILATCLGRNVSVTVTEPGGKDVSPAATSRNNTRASAPSKTSSAVTSATQASEASALTEPQTVSPLKRTDTNDVEYIIEYNSHRYVGKTPSLAFLAILTYLGDTYHEIINSLVYELYPNTETIVLYCSDNGSRYHVVGTNAWIQKNLKFTQVYDYLTWIVSKCGGGDVKYSICPLTTHDKAASTNSPEVRINASGTTQSIDKSTVAPGSATATSIVVEEAVTDTEYIIRYRNREFSGQTPSLVFLAALKFASAVIGVKFKKAIGKTNPITNAVVLYGREEKKDKLRLPYPEAYIDKDLTFDQVKTYFVWILNICNEGTAEFHTDTYSNSQPSSELIQGSQDTLKSDVVQQKKEITKVVRASHTYQIKYDRLVFDGVTPSLAFLAFLEYLSKSNEYTLLSLVGQFNPYAMRITLYECDSPKGRHKLLTHEAYIDKHSTVKNIIQHLKWILVQCGCGSAVFETIGPDKKIINSQEIMPEILSVNKASSSNERISIKKTSGDTSISEAKTSQLRITSYLIQFNGLSFKGDTPSLALLAFLEFFLRGHFFYFTQICNEVNPDTRQVVLYGSFYGNTEYAYKLSELDAYIPKNIKYQQISSDISWILKISGYENINVETSTTNGIYQIVVTADSGHETVFPIKQSNSSAESTTTDNSSAEVLVTAKPVVIAEENSLQSQIDDITHSRYTIIIDETEYCGESPSLAFLSFLQYVASNYHDVLCSLLGKLNPLSKQIAVHRYGTLHMKHKLTRPESYIEKDMTFDQVEKNVVWILGKCGLATTNVRFIGKDNGSDDVSAAPVSDCSPSPDLAQEQNTECEIKATPVYETKAVTETMSDTMPEVQAAPQSAPVSEAMPAHRRTRYSEAVNQAEDFVLASELDGVTADEIRKKIYQNNYYVFAAPIVSATFDSENIIRIGQRYYHREAFVDFEEGADALSGIIEKLFKKHYGLTTINQLFDYACNEMSMFLNDNGINDAQSLFDFASSLFGRNAAYNGKRYSFSGSKYISAEALVPPSVAGIVKNFARNATRTFTYDEIEGYLVNLGLKPGNLRSILYVGMHPDYLIYRENEYLLTEKIGINDSFLDSIKKALSGMFEALGSHIILRSISDSWLQTLPDLPEGLPWTHMLLQQMVRFYDLGAQTIIAMKSQSYNTLHAMIVAKDDEIQDFRDAAAWYLQEYMPERTSFEAEELRQVFVAAGMLSGNELIYNMPKALSADPRFVWSSDGRKVEIRS